ncbi:uncharacterized protein LOC134983156 isoform X4 [Pseudophryne corroboree]|uniref:uncharacterized protein LOC134983156 isoform X4 n=1 Tax=Pseudophryne corroboree TaxID=495146 RepID=UPI003081AF9D
MLSRGQGNRGRSRHIDSGETRGCIFTAQFSSRLWCKGGAMYNIKVENIEGEEEKYSSGVQECKEQETSTDIRTRASNRNTRERCPRPIYSQDHTAESHSVPQGEYVTDFKVEEIKVEEDTYVMIDQLCKEEEIPTDIGTGMKIHTPEANAHDIPMAEDLGREYRRLRGEYAAVRQRQERLEARLQELARQRERAFHDVPEEPSNVGPPSTGEESQPGAGKSWLLEEDVGQTETESATNPQSQHSPTHSEEEGGPRSQTPVSQASTQKRRRQPPFTKRELNILVPQAIGKIHFGRKNMGAGMKDRIWCEITDAVNAVGKIVRTPQEVRRRWADFKSRLKQKKAAHWDAARATGGGSLPDTVEYTELEEQALVCVPYEEVSGVSEIDIDTTAHAAPHALEDTAHKTQVTEAEEVEMSDSSSGVQEEPTSPTRTHTLPQPGVPELLAEIADHGSNNSIFQEQMLRMIQELTSSVRELSDRMHQGMCAISSSIEKGIQTIADLHGQSLREAPTQGPSTSPAQEQDPTGQAPQRSVGRPPAENPQHPSKKRRKL